MQRVSSNLTLLFKLFLPTVWIVFFTTFTIALFLTDEQDLPFLTSAYFKYPFLILYIVFLTILYFSLLQLKRVEMGRDSYFVSNYFKTFRMVYEDIDKLSFVSLGRLQLVTFKLKAKSSFGNKIIFLASTNLYNMFLAEHNEVRTLLAQKAK